MSLILNKIALAVVTTAFSYLTKFVFYIADIVLTNIKIKKAIENARKTGDTTDLEIIINR